MKPPAYRSPRSRLGTRSCRAFTLVEILIATTLSTLLLAAAIASFYMAMHMFEISKAKLGASDEARSGLNGLTAEIRSARLIRVGNGTASSFTEILDDAQQGTAIQIYPTTATNVFIRYFYEPSTQKVKRVKSGSTVPFTVVSCITNSIVFTSEDFAGTILTNNQNNRVIGVTLQFYQVQYPVIRIGPGNLFDYYQLRTKITRRTLE